MSNIYCICCKQLPSGNHKDIFDEKLFINLQKDYNVNETFEDCMILRGAIELITGYAIPKTDNAILCETCFQKVESYIKFRSQLVVSFGRSDDIQVIDLNGSRFGSMTEMSKAHLSFTESEESKEITNENDIHASRNDLSNNGSEINDSSNLCYSTVTLLPNFELLSGISDSISDSDDDTNVDMPQPKIPKSDIESDVNVCSGEDYNGILELAIQKHNDNTSLSESEEDYDYGPTVKKFKISGLQSNFIF